MFISFGNLTKKSILFVVVPIAMLLRVILVTLKKENNMFYHGFLRFLGRSFNGFLWLAIEKNFISKKIEKQDIKGSKLVDPDKNTPKQNNFRS